MWTIKHEPGDFSGFVGNKTVVDSLVGYQWRRPVFLYGPPGCGKTLLVNLLAKEKGWDVVLVSNENIDSIKAVAQTSSIFGGKRLILFDDVELLRDMKKVEAVLKETRNPAIAVTSDQSIKKLAPVKNACEKVVLRKPHKASIAKHLKLICDKEGVQAPQSVLEAVTENSSGDIRSSVNDLQTLAQGRKVLGEDSIKFLSRRDSTSDIYALLSKVYSGKDLKEVVESSWDVSEQPEGKLLWIDDNMPRIYQDAGCISDSLGCLSRASVFLGRIMRRQYWGFLRYATPLMTGGVSCNRPPRVSYSRYQFPAYYGMLGRTRKERALKAGIGIKAGPFLHVSSRVFASQYIPLLKTLLKQEKIGLDELTVLLNLTDEEAEYLAD